MIASDSRGREERLLSVADLVEMFEVEFGVLAALVNRGLFPEPIHMQPPLWKARDVERWRKRVVSK